MKENKGITLIALVITIIVVLILAAVTINQINGNYGIINKTNVVKEKKEISEIIEHVRLDVMNESVGKGKLTKEDVKGILDKYFENVPDDFDLDTVIDSKKEYGSHEIKISELLEDKIWSEQIDNEDENQTIKLSKKEVILDKTLNPEETLIVTSGIVTEWTSSDPEKVEIENGKIKAIKNTEKAVIITAKNDITGKIAVCRVTVVTSPERIDIVQADEDIKLDFEENKSKQLSVKYIPADSNTNTTVICSIKQDENILNISNNGLVKIDEKVSLTTDEIECEVIATLKDFPDISSSKILTVKDTRKYGINLKVIANSYLINYPSVPISFQIVGEKNDQIVYNEIIKFTINKVGDYIEKISLIGEKGTKVNVTALYIGNNKLNNDKIQTVMLDSTEQTIEYNIDYNGSIFSGAYLEVEKSIE